MRSNGSVSYLSLHCPSPKTGMTLECRFRLRTSNSSRNSIRGVGDALDRTCFLYRGSVHVPRIWSSVQRWGVRLAVSEVVHHFVFRGMACACPLVDPQASQNAKKGWQVSKQ